MNVTQKIVFLKDYVKWQQIKKTELAANDKIIKRKRN